MLNPTHKGWFYLCPIYMSDIEGDMNVEARWEWLEWWFTVNEWVIGNMIAIALLINPEYEPTFSIRITGEIK